MRSGSSKKFPRWLWDTMPEFETQQGILWGQMVFTGTGKGLPKVQSLSRRTGTCTSTGNAKCPGEK